MHRNIIITHPSLKPEFKPTIVDSSYLKHLESTLNTRWESHLNDYAYVIPSSQRVKVDEKELSQNPFPYFFALETIVENLDEGEVFFDVTPLNSIVYSCYFSCKKSALEYLTSRRDYFESEQKLTTKKCPRCETPYPMNLTFCLDCKQKEGVTFHYDNLRLDN